MWEDQAVLKRMTRTERVSCGFGEDIEDQINSFLHEKSYLYDLKVEDIRYEYSSTPAVKNQAIIRYSYVGISHVYGISSLLSPPVQKLNIPINKNTLVTKKGDPIIQQMPLKDCLERYDYIPTYGDILYLLEE